MSLMKFYRDATKNLPPAGPMAAEAKEHWKQNHPELHRQLSSLGLLDSAARVAEANAKDHYGRLVEQGADPRAAMEDAKATYITPSGDPPQDATDRAEGETNQVGALHRLLLNGRRNLPAPPTRGTSG